MLKKEMMKKSLIVFGLAFCIFIVISVEQVNAQNSKESADFLKADSWTFSGGGR